MTFIISFFLSFNAGYAVYLPGPCPAATYVAVCVIPMVFVPDPRLDALMLTAPPVPVAPALSGSRSAPRPFSGAVPHVAAI